MFRRIMFKRTVCIICAAAVLIFTAAPALALTAPEISSPSAVLIERETGTVLYEKNSHERLAPASVTKVMTLLLTVEAIDEGRISLEDTVTASAHAAEKGGSQIYLEEGEQMSVEDMLRSVVIGSANDCAAALAEYIAGSEDAFVGLMNERAAELGMADTVFSNCTGLPTEGEHLSSAYDIALMSRELLGHELIKNYTTVWMDTVRNGEFGLTNTNKLVKSYSGATGLKTGYTEAAMYCLSASAERDGVEYIAVVLHDASSAGRFASARALLDYAFANYTLAEIAPETPLTPVPVKLGEYSTVLPRLADEGSISVTKGQAANLTRTVEYYGELEAPVSAGQTIGELRLESNGETLTSVPIVAAEDIARLSWAMVFKRMLLIMFKGSVD